MKDYEERKCVICDAVYKPRRKNQRTCCDPECKEKLRRMSSKKRKRMLYGEYNDKNRKYMRMARGGHVPKPDTIVAIGYAERQMAASLRAAGKVKVEL